MGLRGRHAVQLLAAALCLLSPPAAALAGTLWITVPRSPIPYRSVYADVYRLAPDIQGYSWRLPRKGRVAKSVPPGLYGVVVTAETRKKRSSFVRIVRVRGRIGAAAADVAAAAVPPGVRVSVGGVTMVNPATGAPWKLPSGQVRNLDGPFQTDMVNNEAPCDLGVFEDPEYGRLKDIVRELRFQTTPAFSPADRAWARTALANLKNYAPQYRLQGDVPTTADGTLADGTAHLQLVDLATGDVAWSMSYPVNSQMPPFDMGGAMGLSSIATYQAGRVLCNEPPIPITISGPFWGEAVHPTLLNQVLSWDSYAIFRLKSLERADPARPRAVTAAVYDVPDAIGYLYAHDISGMCTGSGSAQVSVPPEAYLTIDVRPGTGPAKEYDGYVVAISPGATAVFISCPWGDTGTTEDALAALLVRAADGTLPTTDLVDFSGSVSGVAGFILPGYSMSFNWMLTGETPPERSRALFPVPHSRPPPSRRS